MHISSQISVNLLTKWAAQIIKIVIGFIMVPFLLGLFGKAGYGLVGLAGVLISLPPLLDMGLGAGLSRSLAACVAKKDTQAFNELASTAFVLYLLLAMVGASICFLGAPWLCRFFNIPEHLMAEGMFLFRWYGSAVIFISFLGPVYTGTLTSNSRFDLTNYVAVAGGVGHGIAVLIVLSVTDWGFYGWAGVGLAEYVVMLIARRQLARRVWPTLRFDPRLVGHQALSEVFSVGGYAFILNITGVISGRSAPIVLGSIIGPEAVGLFNSGAAIPSRVRPFIRTLTTQLHPLATGFHETDERHKLQAILIRGTRYTLLMGVAACVLMGVFAGPVIKVWLGGKLGPDTHVVAQVLMLWAAVEFVFYLAGSQWPVLLGMKRLAFQVWTQVLASAVIIVLSIFMTKWYGVVGVLIPAVVVGIIRRPIISIYTARVAGISAWQYFKEGYLGALVVGAVMFGLALLCRWTLDLNSLGLLLASVFGVALAWVPLCWWVGFTAGDRASVGSLLRRGTRKLRSQRPAAPEEFPGEPSEDLSGDTYDE